MKCLERRCGTVATKRAELVTHTYTNDPPFLNPLSIYACKEHANVDRAYNLLDLGKIENMIINQYRQIPDLNMMQIVWLDSD